ncbi:MAG TPA: CU044_2847 family protein [Kofleriaceae bacterium]|nr:CU044_2847 family protein [Kofleriaceae bacterium]
MGNNTKIIPLADGLQVEVDVSDGRQAVSTVGDIATKGWSQVEGILRQITGPFLNVYKELIKEATVSEVEVEIGLGFEAEGSIFIAKTSGSANLSVKVTLKPPTITPAA